MAFVPVNPAVLQWARKFRGLDEATASERLGISVADLQAYEAGQKQPTVGIFEKFAGRYRLPQATLFREKPPEAPPAPIDFRTLGGARRTESFDYRIVLSEVRGYLTELRKIALDDEEFLAPRLPEYSDKSDPEALGMRERERLGIGINQQIEWTAAESFGRWRATIEKQGVSVFIKKYPWDDSRGFSLYDDALTPAIVINKNEDADVARSFSLLHEYAHLLIRRPGVSDHNSKNPVEAFCNRFAAAFLMPDAALRKLLPHWPNEPFDWSFGEIAAWAKKLKVSQAALALRLEQAGLAPHGFFGRFNRPNLPASKVRNPPKIDPTKVRVFELGGTYQGAVIGALERDAISEVTAVQALGVPPEKFHMVRANLARQRALASA